MLLAVSKDYTYTLIDSISNQTTNSVKLQDSLCSVIFNPAKKNSIILASTIIYYLQKLIVLLLRLK